MKSEECGVRSEEEEVPRERHDTTRAILMQAWRALGERGRNVTAGRVPQRRVLLLKVSMSGGRLCGPHSDPTRQGAVAASKRHLCTRGDAPTVSVCGSVLDVGVQVARRLRWRCHLGPNGARGLRPGFRSIPASSP